MKKLFLFIFAFVIFSQTASFADTATESTEEAEEYTWEEFPQWSHDLRRTEIITLGSLPFTTLWTILIYGSYQYAQGNTSSFPNPFSSSDAYSEDEIKKILAYSFAASAAIGAGDFIFNFIKRKNSESRLNKIRQAEDSLTITPLTPEEAGELLRKNSIQNVQEENE